MLKLTVPAPKVVWPPNFLHKFAKKKTTTGHRNYEKKELIPWLKMAKGAGDPQEKPGWISLWHCKVDLIKLA